MLPRKRKSSKKTTRRDLPKPNDLALCKTKLDTHAEGLRILGRFEPSAEKLVKAARKVLQDGPKQNRDSKVYARVLGDIQRQTTPATTMLFAATIGQQLASHLPRDERPKLVQFVISRNAKWSCRVLDSLAVAYGFSPSDHSPAGTTECVDGNMETSGNMTARQERKN
jgi:hypothetical protein